MRLKTSVSVGSVRVRYWVSC